MLLSLSQTILAPSGVFYLVVIAENDPDDICAIMSKQGFSAKSVAARKAGNERLQILRFWREPGGTAGNSNDDNNTSSVMIANTSTNESKSDNSAGKSVVVKQGAECAASDKKDST